MKYLLMILLVCACANVAEVHGQQQVQNELEENKIIVYLKNGSKFEARLLEWNTEEKTITFEVYGKPVTFPSDEVRKIVGSNMDQSAVYNFKETGIYYHLRLNFISGNPGKSIAFL